jgi:hypothetical protein
VTGQEAVMATAVLGAGLVVLVPISRAIAARIRGHPPQAVEDSRIDALSSRLEQLQQDMLETQERLDFAERLLAQQRDAPRVGPGAGGGR